MTAPIRFTVSAPNPDNHLLHVRMEIDALAEADHVDLAMPVWSPGSYLVREYSRHVQGLAAVDAQGQPRRVTKLDKASWRVDAAGTGSVIVTYEVFAHDINVRANHLDDTHGFFTGVATYLYPIGRLGDAVELEVVPPNGWRVFTGLETIEGSKTRFRAPDFDVFFDAPVEMGDHDPLDFEACGLPHRMVFWGEGNYDRDQLREDVPKIVEANRQLFGDALPYDDYLFITFLTEDGYGGLEHLNSTALVYPRHGFDRGSDPGGPKDGYLNFLNLVAHEHFHVWNVKRIRPERLGPFDYQAENYTRDLWTVEGITSYYDTRALLRAELLSPKQYLVRVARRIRQLDDVPGRALHSLEDASFDAWIKLYRPDEHTANSSVSYYLKGELVCLLLDLRIREATDGARSLDDVLRHLWTRVYKADGSGYPEGGYERIITEVTGVELGDFFDRFIRGTDDIDWNAELACVGLELDRQPGDDDPKPWLGLDTRSDEGRPVVRFVPTGSPAHIAGIYAGDELVAMGGWKVTAETLDKRVALFAPGDEVEVHLFRRGELHTRTVRLGTKAAEAYRLRTRDDATDAQLDLLDQWIGARQVDTHANGTDSE